MRSLRRCDAAALLATLSDAEQCLYLTREAFASEEELWGWLAEPGWPGLTWIAEDASGAVMGRFVVVPGHADGVVEIGYITVIEHQGKGVASECTKALLEHLFGPAHHPPIRKVIAEVDVRNAPSVRLLEALGFAREGTFREHDATHIGMCDVHLYGLLASEWAGPE